MIRISSIIPEESKASDIPKFPAHKASFKAHHKSKSFACFNRLSKQTIPSLQENLVKSCKCPHVLVADDDPFQEFYYTKLFQTSLTNLSPENKQLNYRIFHSGEALIDRFSDIKTCDCGSQVLIITDYEMGTKKLNGVETALSLRKVGHKGPIVLRTSETKEDLCKKHPTLENLFEKKVIDCLLDKSNHLKTSDTIQGLLRTTTDQQPRKV